MSFTLLQYPVFAQLLQKPIGARRRPTDLLARFADAPCLVVAST
jgi:hypothetical protein